MSKDNKILGRDDILKADDLDIQKVEVPEWGGTVLIKGMSGTARDNYELSIIAQKGEDANKNLVNFRAKLCASSICDEKGKLLFSQKDVVELGKKSVKALQRVYVAALKMSAVTAEDVKELTEGLEERPFEGSASDSQDI